MTELARLRIRSGRAMVAAGLLLALSNVWPAIPATAAPAEDAIQWAVGPAPSASGEARSTIDYTLPPETEITDRVAISNLGTEALTLAVYATDAFTTPEGSFTLLTADQRPVDLGSWISFESPTVTIAPGTTVQVPFRMALPKDATPGDHAAGIVASRQVSGSADGNTRLAVDQRVGTRVYVRVNGALNPALSITKLSVDYGAAMYPFRNRDATVTYTVHNRGNIRLGGTGTISLLAPFGARMAKSQPVSIPPLLPGESFTATATIGGALPAGRVTARMDLDGVNPPGVVPLDTPHQRETATTWAVPWLLAVAVVVLLLAWPGRRMLRTGYLSILRRNR
ncbi:WxL protein peptidoglycan domain-containing protein [Dactylosporangium sp. NPDC048998]|uniref:WxL protein peptidoglycan domain-containing protein n=1 Tax=Dactylosporangium sp. NPDC048998 TaxID=3363976 RepID=UPI00371C7D6B